MNDLDMDQVIVLPRRFAMTLVDTSSFLGSLGQTPSDPNPGVQTTPSSDLISSAMSRVSGASALAQQTGAGAQAQNIDSAGASTFASAP